eukprot:TRINITY_DN9935_c0_g1_i1.p1 TRINITY_DN9935_c0_g1~~TRINITY_DN9935_c0_g1_i1.p1  ORF type:complete len:840 (-),score=230.76 TRINITY_DN9935_c0_g1_i1:93-2612(-)
MEPSFSSFSEMDVSTPSNASKKKRIAPTVIESNDSGAFDGSPSADSKLSSTPRAGKRKTRAPLTKDDIIMDGNLGAPPKRMKTNQNQQHNSTSLNPFSFFVFFPPSAYGALYSQLGDYFEGAVNGDFNSSENPFEPDPAILASLSPVARAEWESILNQLKDVESRPGVIDELWTKLTIVDKIISLFDEDEWRSSNLHWLKLQQDVWWVKTANGWFDKPFSITTEDYLNMGLGCLILELWYRFVWARYTLAVHAKLVEEQNAASIASQQGSNSSTSERRIGAGDDDEDILENSDLGEGAESESEAESSVDEDENGDIPLTFRTPRPALVTNYQKSPLSSSTMPIATSTPKRTKSPFRRSADADPSEPIPMASSGSSSSLHNARADDAVSLVAQAGSFTSMSPVQKAASEASAFDSEDSMENDSLMVCASRADYDDLDVSSAAKQDENQMVQDDDDDRGDGDSSENDENHRPSVFEALSNVAQRTQAPIVAEEEYELQSATEIPPAVSLFFPHPAARQAVDAIESAVFAKEGDWDITRALDVFVDLVDHRNNEAKLQQRSSSAHQFSSNLGTRKQIRAKIEHLYQTKFVPFLKDVGIKVGGDSGRVWKLQAGMESFYDVALVATFGNLSQYGQAPSHNFLQLFPRLAMSSDSRSQIYITQVCYQIHSALQQKGRITPEIDGLISLLDQLIDEKNAILKQIGSVTDAMDDQAVDSDDEDEEKKRAESAFGVHHQALMEKVATSRQNRLREIDQMIESIKDEFNKQTGKIDKLPAKKQKQLANFEQKLNSATASVSASTMEHDDSMDDDASEETHPPTSEVINNLLTDVLGRQKLGETRHEPN